MIESAAGEMSAAPRPCSARKPISIPELRRDAVQERGRGEDDDADEEEPLPSQQVAGAPAEQQEAGEDERVGVDHPLQARLAEAEVFLDVRSATFTIVASRTTMNCARQMRTRTTQGFVEWRLMRLHLRKRTQQSVSVAAAGGPLRHLDWNAPVETSLPVAERPRRPEWMKVRAPSKDGQYFDVQKLVHGLSLHTICEEARCPNISECWGRGTATFQILGDTCTRACRYCYVHSGKPESPPDPLEPLRLAQAAAQMQLKHVVVTSVDRDDVPDRGAGHYAATIRALKAKLPDCKVEILTPDFLGVEEEALQTILAARPEVFNHNIETVRRLHARMRGAKADYDKALWLLRRAKEIADYKVLTKSGIIVGLGETNDEVVETMRDLRANGVDVVTIGQYLQPSAKHAQIDRWVHPDEFRWFREQGEALGFGSVFSGPLVRSSYRADEQRHAAETGRGAVAY